MPYHSAELVDLVQALHADLRDLRKMYEADRAGIATADDAALVAAVFAVAGSHRFTAQQLIDLAHQPGDPERGLRALLGDRLRSARAAGKALAAAAGRPCADTGLVLQRIDRGGRACLWLVSNQPKPASR